MFPWYNWLCKIESITHHMDIISTAWEKAQNSPSSCLKGSPSWNIHFDFSFYCRLITKGWSVFHTNYLRSLDINPLPNKQPSTMRQFLKKTSASFTGMGSIRVRRWAQRALEYHLKTFIHRSSFLLVPCVSCEHITQEKAVFTRGSEKCHMKNFSKKEAVYIC